MTLNIFSWIVIYFEGKKLIVLVYEAFFAPKLSHGHTVSFVEAGI